MVGFTSLNGVLKEKTFTFHVCTEGAGEAGCEAGCENRVRRVECSECQAGAACTNRALQSLGSPPLTFSGGSLVATTNLEVGAVVAQYTGEVMSKETFQTRLAKEYAQKDLSLHVFPLNEQFVVDATIKGSIIRWDL